MADYIIQKAVARDKVKKKLQRSYEDMAANFAAQPKFDGCCNVMRLDWTGEVANFSRTGERYVSLDGVARQFSYKYRREIKEFHGLVLLGEAWNPNLPFNVISGIYRRGQESDELLFMVFDVLTVAEFEAGHSSVGYMDRMARLTSADDDTVATWPPGTYGTVDKFLNEQMELGGRDGIILRDPNGTWTAGRGTTGEIIKVKRELSFDLRVTEVVEGVGEKTGRPVYSLIVDFGGKRLGVGSGLPHDLSRVPMVGQIVEVEAMDYSSDGLLREPRFKGIRYDKLEPDTIAA